MAQLRDTVVSGSLRATDTLYGTTAQFQILRIPTTSNGTVYGAGTSGQVLKTNGTSVYWAADDNTTALTSMSGTLAVNHGGTGSTTADGARTNLGLGSMATETATNYLKWQIHTGDTLNSIYDYGVYVNKGTATTTSINGNKYASIINIPYSKTTNNTAASYAWSIGASTADDRRLFFRTSNATTFSAWQEIAHAPYSTNDIGSATQPVYMTRTGVITAGTALKALAYKDSLVAEDIPTNISITGSAGSCTGNAATATSLSADSTDTTKVFYRGDRTWSNTIKQTTNATLGIDANLKIGTARKDLNFDIAAGSGTSIDSGYAGGITFGSGTSSYGGIYYQGSGSYGSRLLFATTSSFANGAYARMLINSNGYIGIGKLTPNTLLDVNGTVTASTFSGTLSTTRITLPAISGTGTIGADQGSSNTTTRYKPAEWTFNANITPIDGDIITIRQPCVGHDYGTWLTLDNGTSYHPVVYNANSRITTHFTNGQSVMLIYDSTGTASVFEQGGSMSRITTTGVWRVLNTYDSNSDTYGYQLRRIYPNLKAGTGGIFPYTLIMQLPNGRWSSIVTSSISSGTTPKATGKEVNTNGFIPGRVLLMYANVTYTDSANIGTYNIWSAHTSLIDMRYSFNLENSSGAGLTGYTPVYLVGTLEDGLFKLDTTKWWTQTLPTTEDGKLYIYIGDAYDWYRMTFTEEKPIYWYKNGMVQEFSGASTYSVTSGSAASVAWSNISGKPLTLTAASTGFTIAGGTTSKTLTVSDTVTLKTGTATYLAYYSTAGTLSGHGLAHFSDTYSSSTKNGKNEIVLGNATASTANNSAYGQVALYSSGTKGTYLKTADNSTAWYTATLQAKDGTIAYTSDITATAVGLENVTNAAQITKATFTKAYQIMYSTAASTPAVLDANTTATKKFLCMTGTGSAGAVPAWDTLVAADIPNLSASKITTDTFDAARIPTLSITEKTSGTLTVARGGTNLTATTQGGIVYGSGTAAYAMTAAGTTGQVLISNGTSAPIWLTTTIQKSTTSLTNGSYAGIGTSIDLYYKNGTTIVGSAFGDYVIYYAATKDDLDNCATNIPNGAIGLVPIS